MNYTEVPGRVSGAEPAVNEHGFPFRSSFPASLVFGFT